MCEIGGGSKKIFVKKTHSAGAGGGGIFQGTRLINSR